MNSKYTFITNICLAIIVASIVALATQTNFIKRLELISSDYLSRLKVAQQPAPLSKDIVLINLDEQDFYNLRGQGQWPWRRTRFAEAVDALKAFGVKFIYIDVLFSEPAPVKEDDVILAQAIKNAGNVYLPFAYKQNAEKMTDLLLPYKEFYQHLHGTGFVNIFPDIDGTLRRIPVQSNINDQHPYHIALQIAIDHLNITSTKVENNKLLLLNPNKDIQIPLDKNGQMLINWKGKWTQAFTHYSFADILAAHQDILNNRLPKIDVQRLKDKICVIGITAVALYDIKPTPLEPEYPGAGIVATALRNIIENDFIIQPPEWIKACLIYFFVLIPPLLISDKKPFREILSFIFLIIIVAGAYGLFLNNYKIPLVSPLLALFGSYVIVAIYNFGRVSLERRSFLNMAITDELTGLYNARYLKMLLETECLMMRNNTERQFCLIICDIDHFKNINDTHGHLVGDLVLEKVAKQLKASVRALDIVARYGGDEFILILRGALLKEAKMVGEKIRANIEQLIIKDNKMAYQVTLSIGVALFNPQTDSPMTLIKKADQVLYESKKTGRNKVAIFTEKESIP